MLGGDGDDSILNNHWFGNANNVFVDGGAGNDYIEIIDVYNTTISGGTGNDFVINGGSHAVYIYEGGNDTIESASWGNSIIVIENYTWTTARHESENALIVTVKDNDSVVGTITIDNFFARTFNIVSSRDEVATFNNPIQYDDELNPIEGTNGNDYLVNGQSDKTISVISLTVNPTKQSARATATIGLCIFKARILQSTRAQATIKLLTGSAPRR